MNDPANGLEPADIYALQQVLGCHKLYRFAVDALRPLCWRLDRPDGAGDFHVVAPGRITRLAQLRMVRIVMCSVVAGSDAWVEPSASGINACFDFRWPSVSREWNEMPWFAMQGARRG